MGRTAASRESGMALLMVLGVLAVTMVMISHIILMVQVVTGESYQISRQTALRYEAESAADTAIWYHFTDRRLFSDRTLGKAADNGTRADYDWEGWMLDGKGHFFNDRTAVVYLGSGESGTRVDRLAQLKDGYDAADEAEQLDLISIFIDAYEDYVDGNDETRLRGYENADYAADGFPTLPRNAAMQFKAELYWLPGWGKVLNGPLCIVPPPKISYSFQSQKPSLFNATDEQFRRLLGYEDDSPELAAVRDALKEWREKGTALEDILEADLLIELRNSFDFNEPGVMLCHAEAYDANREVHAVYRVTREANLNSRTVFADRRGECLSIWERLRE